jgi:hypothetical protein
MLRSGASLRMTVMMGSSQHPLRKAPLGAVGAAWQPVRRPKNLFGERAGSRARPSPADAKGEPPGGAHRRQVAGHVAPQITQRAFTACAPGWIATDAHQVVRTACFRVLRRSSGDPHPLLKKRGCAPCRASIPPPFPQLRQKSCAPGATHAGCSPHHDPCGARDACPAPPAVLHDFRSAGPFLERTACLTNTKPRQGLLRGNAVGVRSFPFRQKCPIYPGATSHTILHAVYLMSPKGSTLLAQIQSRWMIGFPASGD